ncbi:MAG: hypothetical protein R2827_01635 [Bdellovibrionales bacterium]
MFNLLPNWSYPFNSSGESLNPNNSTGLIYGELDMIKKLCIMLNGALVAAVIANAADEDQLQEIVVVPSMYGRYCTSSEARQERSIRKLM